MEMNCESVQMSDMQWTKVCVKSIVEKGIINGEIDWRWSYSIDSSRSVL